MKLIPRKIAKLFDCCPTPDIQDSRYVCRGGERVRKYCFSCGVYQTSPYIPTWREWFRELKGRFYGV